MASKLNLKSKLHYLMIHQTDLELINKLSEETLLLLLSPDYSLLSQLENASRKVEIAAVERNAEDVKYVKDDDDQEIQDIVTGNGHFWWNYPLIKHPTRETKVAILSRTPNYIVHMKDASDELKQFAKNIMDEMNADTDDESDVSSL